MCAVAGVVWIFSSLTLALAVLAALLVLVLLHHQHNMGRVVSWAQQAPGTPLPRGIAAWDYIYASLARRERQAQEQRARLTRSLKRFREATQALPDGVIYLTRQRTIEWVNEAAASYFGLDAERDIGRAVTSLVREPAFVSYLANPSAEPVILRGGHHEGLTLAVQVIPFGEDQEMVLARDITQLERLDMMRRDFVANVSHELKTPLTVVSGFVETLIDGDEDFSVEDRRHFLELTLSQSQRMQRLVDDLLTLSSLQSGDAPRGEEVVDVQALVQGVLNEARLLSRGRHEIVCEQGPAAAIVGSQKELYSAFSNLVSNAVRYTPEHGEIRVSWSVLEDGSGRFAVEDSGIGIEPQHLERLTERFYRVDQGRSRETGGTGLGLAIVKHVLTRHNAQLGIASQPGTGSCFTAHFPVRRLRLPG
ncbi:phosphate regulon sensor histidine kinase PhoR [Uliginosibacterium paludis]|uniref:Phosphate regulon sensor protein PhoR n=1 Tax=Uliginosibacterium paludis TaxID=1615952 RepID=A0ABV2CP31_9RHOO